MGVLATYMAALRSGATSIATGASLYALPENESIDDAADRDKTVFSVCRAVSSSLGLPHGGGTYIEYRRDVVIKVAWFMDDDEEALEDTIANDCEAIDAVMLKVSNWTSGIVLVEKGQESEERIGTVHRADLHYPVRFRVTQNLT